MTRTPLPKLKGKMIRTCAVLVCVMTLSYAILTEAKEGISSETSKTTTSISRLLSSSTLPGEYEEDRESEPAIAVLFPWFVETIGIIIFFILTRYAKALPFTAVMFLIGTIMGICANRFGSSLSNQLEESILEWQEIDGEVLLLVFLPGLIFRDAFNLNVHLFWKAKEQCLLFAFPMVLGGTVLTACVAYYVFPYEWSFHLAMTFGSILSATDPVAVSALLNELGAPPRLKMHISGESLLNDGSAIVFFFIFKELFLTELNLDGIGQTYSVGEGFSLFFRLSLGGVAIGIAFGLGLILLLFLLQRRLNVEENAVQVTATIAFAYLTYYTADVVCETSGVIATVICGSTVKALGSTMINDPTMLDSFWIMVEHILNTLLFTLGGVVWGTVIANPENEVGDFVAKDWGYLILLYICLVAIRFFLMFSFYPLISRIGLKSNLQEAFFMSYGGLRGAVGIALALSLDNEVFRYMTIFDESNEERNSSHLDKYREQTSKVFGMVGGIALLTLVVNATTSGPLLRALHLADSPKARQDIVKRYRHALKKRMVDNLVHLLSYPRYQQIDFGIVQAHTPLISKLTVDELKVAMVDHRAQIPITEYNPPNLQSLVPYLSDLSQYDGDISWLPRTAIDENDQDENAGRPSLIYRSSLMMRANEHTATAFRSCIQVTAIEIRKIFVELLRHSYQAQIMDGELDGREGFLSNTLLLSLDFTSDAVSKGLPIQDWEEAMKATSIFQILTNRNKLAMSKMVSQVGMLKKSLRINPNTPRSSFEYMSLRIRVHGALACMAAHRWAQDRLRSEYRDIHFGSDSLTKKKGSSDDEDDLSLEWKIVLEESQKQFELAKKVVTSTDKAQVKIISSHLVATILLNKAAQDVETVVQSGLLKEQEAEGYLEEFEHNLDCICHCSDDHLNTTSVNEEVNSS